MYIEITSDIPERQLKAGDRYHEKYEFALILLALGKAKEVADPNAPKREVNPAQSGPGSTAVPFFAVPRWSAVKHPINGEIFVQKKYCSETALYQEPLPSACPPDVAELYRKMVRKNDPQAQFVANDRQRGEIERSMGLRR